MTKRGYLLLALAALGLLVVAGYLSWFVGERDPSTWNLVAFLPILPFALFGRFMCAAMKREVRMPWVAWFVFWYTPLVWGVWMTVGCRDALFG